MSLYLAPDGDVRPCCKNFIPLGNVARTRLLEIWQGEQRRLLEARVADLDFSLGCMQCQREVEVEGREVSYPATFDRYADAVLPSTVEQWPLHMEFNISSTCNLQCIQCNGLLSSSIRIHREKKAPLPKVYGEDFFADLEHFIPHLQDAQFAGGEPFLAPENFRVWEMIERLNPDLPLVAVTNATQWNPKVARVVEQLKMGFNFSLDAVTKELYESVRVNAHFESVMANVERYSSRARANGRFLEVNYCLMLQNHQGFADVLRWAEEREMVVHVSVVRYPPHCSLAAAPDDVLREALDRYERQYDEVAADLTINAAAWATEVDRVRGWLSAGSSGRRQVWGEMEHMAHLEQERVAALAEGEETRIDYDAVVATFRSTADGAPVFELLVTDQGTIVGVSNSLQELGRALQVELIGEQVDRFDELVATYHGERRLTQESNDPDLPGVVSTEVTYGRTRFRSLAVPAWASAGDVTSTAISFYEVPRS